MVTRVSNLTVVFLAILLSGCYLSYEISRSVEADSGSASFIGGSPPDTGGSPATVGSNPAAVGGSPPEYIDEPFVDAGIDEVSLLGAWQGRMRFVYNGNDSFVLDGIRFEFTDKEVFISYGDMELYEGGYSINRDVIPFQLNINLEAVNEYLAPQITETHIESINAVHPFSATFRIEDDELTITAPTIPMPTFSLPTPGWLDPGESELTVSFELTGVR